MSLNALWRCRECGTVRAGHDTAPPGSGCPACGSTNPGDLYARVRL